MKPQTDNTTTEAALGHETVCGNCATKLYQTADPNNVHWYHKGTGDVCCPTRFAKPVSASAVPVKCNCGHVGAEHGGIDLRYCNLCSAGKRQGFTASAAPTVDQPLRAADNKAERESQ